MLVRENFNIGLPIVECPEAATEISAGDDVTVDFDGGVVYNNTTGKSYKAQPYPEFMQRLISAGGLIPYLKAEAKEE